MALRDELRCLDVGRTSGRAIAGYRCARAYLLRLQFRLRYLPDAVKATPGYEKHTSIAQINTSGSNK